LGSFYKKLAMTTNYNCRISLSNDHLHGHHVSDDDVEGAEKVRQSTPDVESNGGSLDQQVPDDGQVADGRNQLGQIQLRRFTIARRDS